MSERKKICPLLKKQCIELDCVWYTNIYSSNGNETVEHWDCAIKWLPSLLVENSIQQRNTGSSVETFRNEMVKANEQTASVFKIMLETANKDNLLLK